MPISRVGFQFIQIIMSSRNKKLACLILEAMDCLKIDMDTSAETIMNAFDGYSEGDVEWTFRLLCQAEFLLLKKHEVWAEVKPKFCPLSWKGHDLLEQLQKEVQEET